MLLHFFVLFIFGLFSLWTVFFVDGFHWRNACGEAGETSCICRDVGFWFVHEMRLLCCLIAPVSIRKRCCTHRRSCTRFVSFEGHSRLCCSRACFGKSLSHCSSLRHLALPVADCTAGMNDITINAEKYVWVIWICAGRRGRLFFNCDHYFSPKRFPVRGATRY